MTAPLAASLSNPSSLDRDRLTMTRPDDQEVRLRESRRERARCPACGKLGILEVLTVHRPGLPSVRRTVIRCTRTGHKDPRGRELASTRCPLAVVSEEPLPVVAGEFREFREDHEKGVGEFWQFCQDHKKGPDPDPLPVVEARRLPQDSAPGDFRRLPVEAARDAQDAFEAPPLPATSSNPEPAPLGRPGDQESDQEPEEDTMPEEPTATKPTRRGRACKRCATPIDGVGGRRYCPDCAVDVRNEGRRALYRKKGGRARKPRAIPSGRLSEVPTPAPSRPLDVLHQLLALDPETRAAVLVLARTEAA